MPTRHVPQFSENGSSKKIVISKRFYIRLIEPCQRWYIHRLDFRIRCSVHAHAQEWRWWVNVQLVIRPTPHRASVVDEGCQKATLEEQDCREDWDAVLSARTPSVASKNKPRTVNVPGVHQITKKLMQRNDEVSPKKTAFDWHISRRGVQNIAKQELGSRSYRLFRGHTLTETTKARLEKWKELFWIHWFRFE